MCLCVGVHSSVSTDLNQNWYNCSRAEWLGRIRWAWKSEANFSFYAHRIGKIAKFKFRILPTLQATMLVIFRTHVTGNQRVVREWRRPLLFPRIGLGRSHTILFRKSLKVVGGILNRSKITKFCVRKWHFLGACRHSTCTVKLVLNLWIRLWRHSTGLWRNHRIC